MTKRMHDNFLRRLPSRLWTQDTSDARYFAIFDVSATRISFGNVKWSYELTPISFPLSFTREATITVPVCRLQELYRPLTEDEKDFFRLAALDTASLSARQLLQIL